ncbi:MAG: hypothetical protein KAI25_05270 [Hyphomicrobiaceae bacterium]|nr:hypothetical protein [Hyphomicrobiaceae bacterium]
MKAHRIALGLFFVVLATVAAAYAQETAEEIYQSALYQEDVQGNLESAIDSYHQLAYSPDGSRIAHNAGGKIWITASDGGAPEELRTGLPEGANHSEFGWSPSGEKIVFMALIGGEPEFWLIRDFLPE